MLFAGVHEPGPPRLPGLAAQVGRALLPLGVEPERRAFHAHVTLARVIPGRVLAPRTRIRMEREAAADLGAERLSVLALILSPVGAPRYPYKDLTTYELSGEASR